MQTVQIIRKAHIYLFQILLVMGCSLFEQDEDPDPIIWAEEDLTGMVLYSFAHSSDSLVVVDLVTSEILMVISGYEMLQSVQVNDAGTRLYVAATRYQENPSGLGPGAIYEVDTQTWSSRQIYGHSAQLITNRNGGIYFITKPDPETGAAPHERMFGKIEPETGVVIELGPLNVNWRSLYDDKFVEIHPTEPVVYHLTSDSELWLFNYQTGERVRLFQQIDFQQAASFTLSADGRTLYIPGGPVLDLAGNRISGSIPVWWLGHIAVRRDDREIYITDPGSLLSGLQPSGKVFVYEPGRNRVTEEISVLVDGMPGRTEYIYLTPKDRFAIGSDFRIGYFIIDLKKREVVYSHKFLENNARTLSMEGMIPATKPSSLQGTASGNPINSKL